MHTTQFKKSGFATHATFSIKLTVGMQLFQVLISDSCSKIPAMVC